MGQYTHQAQNEISSEPIRRPNWRNSFPTNSKSLPTPRSCFIWTTFEDTTVPMENSMLFASALRKNNVPFALDIYQKGGHGLGLADKPPFYHPHPWAADCLVWLQTHEFVK